MTGDGVAVTITPELTELARAEGWSGGELFATALVLTDPDLRDVEINVPPNPGAKSAALRRGYTARPVPGWRSLDRAALGYGDPS